VLSLIVFTPLLGVLLLLFVPGTAHRPIRWIALVASVASLAFSLTLLGYDPNGSEFQYREDLAWIEAFGMRYTLGVDGLSAVMVLLTTILSVVSIFYSWEPIQHRVKEYYISMLVLMTGMLGVFVALDLFLFYVFWEVSLIPMYVIIGIWGGPRRIYATVKFVIYTLVGSLLMLVAILAVAIAHAASGNPFTFSYEALRGFSYADSLQALAFIAFFLAFAIKVPMWPLHTWLPDAHVEAPTAGSIILAGVLLKLGGYGFLRYSMPLLPDATVSFAPMPLLLSKRIDDRLGFFDREAVKHPDQFTDDPVAGPKSYRGVDFVRFNVTTNMSYTSLAAQSIQEDERTRNDHAKRFESSGRW
jgi:NADH-quinone oxidoreductase subunit M